jgi:hypothetical protein
MGTKVPDDKATPAPAEHAGQLMEERQTIIREYAGHLREILNRLRKWLN